MPYPPGDIPTRERRNHQTEKITGDLVYQFADVIKPYLDAPYQWGGTTPYGIDCSGLVMVLYKEAAGISLPHSTLQMYNMGRPVHKNYLKFADLLFFNTKGGIKPNHVGFYLSEGVFLHASVSRGVTLDNMWDSPYNKQLLGARRILHD